MKARFRPSPLRSLRPLLVALLLLSCLMAGGCGAVRDTPLLSWLPGLGGEQSPKPESPLPLTEEDQGPGLPYTVDFALASASAPLSTPPAGPATMGKTLPHAKSAADHGATASVTVGGAVHDSAVNRTGDNPTVLQAASVTVTHTADTATVTAGAPSPQAVEQEKADADAAKAVLAALREASLLEKLRKNAPQDQLALQFRIDSDVKEAERLLRAFGFYAGLVRVERGAARVSPSAGIEDNGALLGTAAASAPVAQSAPSSSSSSSSADSSSGPSSGPSQLPSQLASQLPSGPAAVPSLPLRLVLSPGPRYRVGESAVYYHLSSSDGTTGAVTESTGRGGPGPAVPSSAGVTAGTTVATPTTLVTAAARAPLPGHPLDPALPDTLEKAGLIPGQGAEAAAVLDAVDSLPGRLATQGYPLGKVLGTRYIIDHKRRVLCVSVLVDPGPKARMGVVQVQGESSVSPEYLQGLRTWPVGRVWNQAQVERYQDVLTRQGLFRSMQLEAKPAMTAQPSDGATGGVTNAPTDGDAGKAAVATTTGVAVATTQGATGTATAAVTASVAAHNTAPLPVNGTALASVPAPVSTSVSTSVPAPVSATAQPSASSTASSSAQGATPLAAQKTAGDTAGGAVPVTAGESVVPSYLSPMISGEPPLPVYDVVLTVADAPQRTVGGGLFYESDRGLGGQAYWEHRNFLGAGENFRAEAQVWQDSQYARMFFRKPAFLHPRQELTSEAWVRNEDTIAYSQQAAFASVGIERRFLRRFVLRAGGSLEGGWLKDSQNPSRGYSMAALPLAFRYEGAGSVLDSVSGVRGGLGLTPTVGWYGEPFSMVPTRADVAMYWPLWRDAGGKEKAVLAARLAAGTLWRDDARHVPASVRYYGGGGGSVRGYAFQSLGPRDKNGDPLGGASFVETGLEVRVKLSENISLVPFLDGGNVYPSSIPALGTDGMQWGGGLGLRYHTAVGPIRLDVATPLNPRHDDAPFFVYISIGQSF